MKKLITFLLLILILVSCGPSTKITASWADQEIKPVKFKHLAIVGIGNRANYRKLIEETLETELLNEGINAIAALDFLPPNATKQNLTKEELIGFLNSNKIDGVLTISLLSYEDTRRYVPGNYYYTPGYDIPFTDYYGQMYAYVYQPGYYTGSEQFFLESNVYEYPKGKMIWSAQTKTQLFSSLGDAADDYAKVIARALAESGVLVVNENIKKQAKKKDY